MFLHNEFDNIQNKTLRVGSLALEAKMKIICCGGLILALFSLTESCPDELVHDLPGVEGNLSSRLFSGYVEGLDYGHKFHYIFVESEKDPINDPVVLWLNGGPGCTSMSGFFQGLGPYNLQPDLTLQLNKYRWTQDVNLLVIEGPPGLGYSFVEGVDNHTSSDELHIDGIVAGIQSFLTKFHEYQKNEFFICGESYAGMLIPHMTYRALKKGINTKGYMEVSSGPDLSIMCATRVFYWYHNGLISESIFDQLRNKYCKGSYDMKDCTFSKNCDTDFSDYASVANFGHIDLFNTQADCDYNPNHQKHGKDFEIHYVCYNKDDKGSYMNKEDVRKALNIKEDPHIEWIAWNDMYYGTGYEKTVLSCEDAVKKLIEEGIYGWFMYGNSDAFATPQSGLHFIKKFKQETVEELRPFTVRGKLAGYTKADKMLRYVLFMNSGHEIPLCKPDPLLETLRNFLKNEAPPTFTQN